VPVTCRCLSDPLIRPGWSNRKNLPLAISSEVPLIGELSSCLVTKQRSDVRSNGIVVVAAVLKETVGTLVY
jgi:hypothetical protein